MEHNTMVNLVNIIPADDLATDVASTSADMILTSFSQYLMLYSQNLNPSLSSYQAVAINDAKLPFLRVSRADKILDSDTHFGIY